MYINSTSKKSKSSWAWYMAQISTIASCNSPWGMSYGHNPHISTIQSLLGYIIWRTISSFQQYNPFLGISYGVQLAHFHYTILPWVYHKAHNQHISSMQSFLGYIIRRTIRNIPSCNPTLDIIWCTNLIKIRCLNRSHIRYTNI